MSNRNSFLRKNVRQLLGRSSPYGGDGTNRESGKECKTMLSLGKTGTFSHFFFALPGD
jgi:hypothetical protein